MRAGALDRRLTIRRRVQTGTDGLNNPIFSFEDLRTVWAAKVHKAEAERFDPGTHQRFAERSATFRTHFMDDVVETDILVCEGVTYDIKGIREIARREGLEFSAEAQF